MSESVSGLSNNYNSTNVKAIEAKLKAVKQAFGQTVFAQLLSDIKSKDDAKISQTVRIYS